MNATLARTLIEHCRRDPVFFCREVLGVEPWQRQAEVLAALRDAPRVAVRSGHGTGKTFTAACAALWFLYAFHPAKVVTTAPTQALVRNVLWNEIRRLHAGARLPVGGRALEEAIKLGPDAFALGLSTDEAERFQGFHAEHLLVILDEAPGVRPEVWEAAETLLTTRGSRLLAIGNPTRPSGPFYAAFAPGSAWRTVRISCWDSPNLDGDAARWPALVTRDWIETHRRAWGETSPLYRARVLGEFPDDGAGALFPRAAVEAAVGRPAPDGPADPATLRLGVDVARTGEDATAFCLRDARGVRLRETARTRSTMETAGRVRQLVREHDLVPGHVFMDDTGLGAGVTDGLVEDGLAVTPVVLGAAPRDRDHFANVRAECYWALREAIGDPARGFALAGDADLARELGALRYELTGAGAIRIEPKDAIRARLGGSPDRADALALTFAAPRPVFDPAVVVV